MNTDLILSTGQISGLTQIGYMTLYRYVKDFYKFFSPSVKRHKRGRRWTLDDLEKVQAIRYLHHERTSKKEIEKKLSSGWKPEINPIYSRETLSRIIEQNLLQSKESRQMVKDVQKSLNDIKDYKKHLENLAEEIFQTNLEVQKSIRNLESVNKLYNNVSKVEISNDELKNRIEKLESRSRY